MLLHQNFPGSLWVRYNYAHFTDVKGKAQRPHSTMSVRAGVLYPRSRLLPLTRTASYPVIPAGLSLL